MGSLLEGLVEMFSEGGEEVGGGAEGGAEAEGGAGAGAGAAGEANNAIDTSILSGVGDGSEVQLGAGAGASKVGGDAAEGIKDAQQEVKDVVEKIEKGDKGASAAAQALEASWTTKFTNIWSSAKTFGLWAGTEAAKGALFFGGTKALEAIFAALSPAAGAGGAATNAAPASNDKMLQITKTINAAGLIMRGAIDGWAGWLAAHYDKHTTYGFTTANGIQIQNFQIVQNALATASDQRDQMQPLMTAAATEKTLDATNAFLSAFTAYAKSLLDLSSSVQNMTAMVNDGLLPKQAEIQSAYNMLVAAAV